METAEATIQLGCPVEDCAFSPTSPLLAAGTVKGFTITDVPSPVLRNSIKAHVGPVRAVKYSSDGSFFLTGGRDKTIRAFNSETMQQIWEVKPVGDGHKHPLYSLLLPNDNGLVSGDEGGTLKIWDLRTQQCLRTHTTHADYISDLAYVPDQNSVVATSGDGTFSAYLLDQGFPCSFVAKEFEDAYLSGGERILVGTESHGLQAFNWGHWQEPSVVVRRHPSSSLRPAFEKIVAYGDELVLTCAEDGLIRILDVTKNFDLAGVLGQHEFPVERLTLNASKTLFASVSHDNCVRLWDATILADDGPDDDDDQGDSPAAAATPVSDAQDSEMPVEGEGAASPAVAAAQPTARERRALKKKEKARLRKKNLRKATEQLVTQSFFAGLTQAPPPPPAASPPS